MTAARAAQYGDGLFETILMTRDRGWLLDRHLARLDRGLTALELAWPAPEQLAEALDAAELEAAAHPHSILKLLVSASAVGRGYGRASDNRSQLRTALFPATHTPVITQRPAVVGICDLQLAVQPRLAGIKHLNRLEQVLAANQWQRAGYDEGLMFDTRGQLVEGTFSNVVLLLDGELVTPALDGAGVAGVLREALLAAQCVVAQPLCQQDLARAQALWLINSVFGLRAVAKVADAVAPISFDLVATQPQDHTLRAQVLASYSAHQYRWRDVSPSSEPLSGLTAAGERSPR